MLNILYTMNDTDILPKFLLQNFELCSLLKHFDDARRKLLFKWVYRILFNNRILRTTIYEQ